MASIAFQSLKSRALEYNALDYPFYLQFSARLLDTIHSSPISSTTVSGYNWMGFHGIDGAGGHAALHLEPIKYIYAVLYAVSGTRISLYVFTALVLFSPLFTYFHRAWTPGAACLLATNYVFAPAVLYASAFDLRPYLFLAPLLFLAINAAMRRSPFWTLFWFNAVFLAREEALVLTLFVMAYVCVAWERNGVRSRILAGLFVSWVAWVLVTVGFFYWTGYPHHLQAIPSHPGLGTICALIAGSLIFGAVIFMVAMQYASILAAGRPDIRPVLGIIAFALILVPLGWLFFRLEWLPLTGGDFMEYNRIIFAPRLSLYTIIFLSLAGLIWHHFAREGVRHRVEFALLIAAGVSIFLHVMSPNGILLTWQAYGQRADNAARLFGLRHEMQGRSVGILCDNYTLQAFCEMPEVYTYSRLPPSAADAEHSTFPANTDILVGILREKIGYVVVSRTGRRVAQSLLNKSGLVSSVILDTDEYFAGELPPRPGMGGGSQTD
ncbi:MAG: DUF2079 domain-containing protein [Candidatus Hydrogenedentes bacterium]|nr:DUF2079 domain-containing protein [Candidatus Hydrogenedentota bacterium]